MRCAGFTVLCLLAVSSIASAQTRGYADADSADIADDALAGVDAADAADVAEALADGPAPPWAGGRPSRAVFARLERVAGYRTSERLTTGARGIAVGARRTPGRTSQWIDAKGDSWVRRITVGGLRVHCGQGLVLGATRSRFARATPGSSAGLTVGPSLSLTRPLRGVAVTVGRGHTRATGVVWRVADGAAGRWLSLGRTSGRSALAVSAGVLTDADDGIERAAVSLSGAGGDDGHGLAGEVALFGHAAMALLRTTVTAAGVWTAEVFAGAATDASGGVARVAADGSRERGAALHRRDVWAGWNTSLSLYTVTREGNDGGRLRRRLDCRAAYTSPMGVRYDVSARYDDDRETTVAWGPLVGSAGVTHARRGRIRGRVDIPAGAALTFRYLAEARLEPMSHPGVLSGLAVRWDASRVDVSVTATNFALAGSGGYLARPGIAGYESVSAVGRRGSDIAARATIRLGYGADVTLYAGAPWERAPRCLASFRWAL